MMKKCFTDQEKIAIQTFEEGDPNENPWVNGQPKAEHIQVVAYDAQWPVLFDSQYQRIQSTLGPIAQAIVHVGSTAVPTLAAKPIIDIDLIVEDPSLEDLYAPALTELGYELTIREPSWYQHRMFRLDAPRINLHVFGPNCPEHWRHLLFKAWLINHPDDRLSYAKVKEQSKLGVTTIHEYNLKKQDVVRAIYQKIFTSLK